MLFIGDSKSTKVWIVAVSNFIDIEMEEKMRKDMMVLMWRLYPNLVVSDRFYKLVAPLGG